MPDAYSKNIVYLSQAQYQELITNNTITVDGVTVNYNENDIYVTPQAEPVLDVKINNASIVSNDIATIPISTTSTYGVAKIDSYPTTDSPNAVRSGGVKSYLNDKADKEEAYQFITGTQATSTASWIGKEQTGVTSLNDVNAILYKLPYANPSGTPVTFQLQCYAQNEWAGMAWVTSVQGSTISMIQNIPVYYNGVALEGEYAAGTVFAMHFDSGVWYVDAIMPENVVSALAGKVGDIQIDGSSIVSNGTATIPLATTASVGLVKYGGTAIGVNASGQLYVNTNSSYGVRSYSGTLALTEASTAEMKAGTNGFKVIMPSSQHTATFYGLAKAAGDATQSASSNAVGTYTDSAKASIKSMLGIIDGSTGTVDITGTTPTITAVENTRYVCGEVSTLSFTPAASGICIVRFTSGSSVTILTLPSTVKFPEWFDPTSLETNTIYEICVTDGEFGAVMSWAL